MTRDMSVFDDIERQAQVFDAVRYLERSAARRKRRRVAASTALGVGAGLIGTCVLHTRLLLLSGGDYSVSAAASAAAVGTLPLLLGLGAYIAGLQALRTIDADLDRFDPAPVEPLLGVVPPSEELQRSSSKPGSAWL